MREFPIDHCPKLTALHDQIAEPEVAVAQHRRSWLRWMLSEPTLGNGQNRTVRREGEANLAIRLDLVDRLRQGLEPLDGRRAPSMDVGGGARESAGEPHPPRQIERAQDADPDGLTGDVIRDEDGTSGGEPRGDRIWDRKPGVGESPEQFELAEHVSCGVTASRLDHEPSVVGVNLPSHP